MTYAEENMEDIVDELKPLFERHYHEIARHRDIIKLEPDYETYFKMQELGTMIVTTAREDDGWLAGYMFTFVMLNPHFKSVLMASNDVIYLRPESRKGNNGRGMIEFTEQCLRKLGVKKHCITLKIAHDFGILLERMGYTPIERVYEIMLGEV